VWQEKYHIWCINICSPVINADSALTVYTVLYSGISGENKLLGMKGIAKGGVKTFNNLRSFNTTKNLKRDQCYKNRALLRTAFGGLQGEELIKDRTEAGFANVGTANSAFSSRSDTACHLWKIETILLNPSRSRNSITKEKGHKHSIESFKKHAMLSSEAEKSVE